MRKTILVLTFITLINYTYSQSLILRTGPQMEIFNFSPNSYVSHLPTFTSPTVELLYSQNIHPNVDISTGLRYIPYTSRLGYKNPGDLFYTGSISTLYHSLGVPIQLNLNLLNLSKKVELIYSTGIIPIIQFGPNNYYSQYEGSEVIYQVYESTTEDMFNLLLTNGIGLRYHFKFFDIGLEAEYNAGLVTNFITYLIVTENNNPDDPTKIQISSKGDYWIINFEFVFPFSNFKKTE